MFYVIFVSFISSFKMFKEFSILILKSPYEVHTVVVPGNDYNYNHKLFRFDLI